MSERSLQNNGLKLPYRDLASEVTRRRFTMASRYPELCGWAVLETAGDTGLYEYIQMYSNVSGAARRRLTL